MKVRFLWRFECGFATEEEIWTQLLEILTKGSEVETLKFIYSNLMVILVSEMRKDSHQKLSPYESLFRKVPMSYISAFPYSPTNHK